MFSSAALLVALPLAAVALYVLWTFLALLVRQARSPLRRLRGPPSPSFFMGNLREMHDQENTGLFARWEAAYGSTFVYHGFIGGARLLTTDPVAVAHILGRGYEFPKPDFIRDALASMAAGHEGLLVVEGEDHRRQRKILSPAFATPHIKSLSPIIWEKATQLRDIWLDVINSSSSSTLSTPPDPFALETSTSGTDEKLPPCARATGFLPNPFASFVSSKARPRAAPTPATAAPPEERTASPGAKVDVLAWLARATLDVIGEAGFGYAFNSLSAASDTTGGKGEDELARAFAVIFSTARKFRVATILQVWFPVLRRFRRNSAAEDSARATMNRIGLDLIAERRREVLEDKMYASQEAMDGRDLLTVMIKSSLSSDPSQQLSTNEMLCQIATFLAAGHETSSSALTWTLYALARAPASQHKLRAELQSLALPPEPSSDALQRVLALPYLDAVVREALRVHAPVTSTMRVAAADAAVPVAAPFRDARGRPQRHIRLHRGDIVTVPLQAVNKSAGAWGADAGVFRPERWLEDGARGDAKGLWGGVMTFGTGVVVSGNRSCIGYRFAVNEIKLFLFALVRDIEFAIDPWIEVEKRVNVVTRPCVKSEPHMGNQMPLRLRRAGSSIGEAMSDTIATETGGMQGERTL
ncbi:cytochrome P450 [Phanerochaete sordida]|uniref:Cytochrome P450 n=1 Tax=Phanerochaete sordida TaxID=48140 RepID=A0A9P3GDG6_9APHY|nr:cytochrome P450 [Phanerochaete sordida]